VAAKSWGFSRKEHAGIRLKPRVVEYSVSPYLKVREIGCRSVEALLWM